MPVERVSGNVVHTDSDMSEHISEARARARAVFSAEGHIAIADDWRYSTVSARTAAILLCMLWEVLVGFGTGGPTGLMLCVSGLGLAVFLGIAAALVSHTEVTHFEAELERERREVAEEPRHEREEVVALYAAKGFREPLLSQVVDVLCADDDRLLKIMMEEELGLFLHPTMHPFLVGVVNGMAALLSGLVLAVPAMLLAPTAARWWVPAAAAGLVTALSLLIARHTRQTAVPLVARWLVTGTVCVGAVYFLAQLATGRG